MNDIYDLKRSYRKGKANLGKEFFTPCFSNCLEYRRAVAYYTSSSLVAWAEAMPDFIKNNGKIKLILSLTLAKEDLEIIKDIENQKTKDEWLQEYSDRILLNAIDFSNGDYSKKKKLFAELLLTKKIEICFSYAKNEDGDFHPKIGVFNFNNGKKVSFTGSANETFKAMTKNYESIVVFRSWVSDEEKIRIEDIEEEFEELWNNENDDYIVKRPSKKVLDKIRIYCSSGNNKKEKDTSGSYKWRHQEEALEIFLKKKKGILEMATGTGKTRTALKIIDRLMKEGEINLVIVSTDGNDLMEQWDKNILSYPGVNEFLIYRDYDKFHEKDEFISDPSDALLIIRRSKLHHVLRDLKKENLEKCILIHDEVHKIGSPSNIKNLKGLSKDITYNLGLSATPDREYDTDGTNFIKKEVGEVIYKFSVEDAIQRRILCPFNYHPINYRLTNEEKKKIKNIHAAYQVSQGTSNPMSEKEMRIKISDIYKTSLGKIEPFKKFIKERPKLLKNCIIFVHTKEFGNNVYNTIHRYNSEFHTYFSGEDSKTLEKFKVGKISCLITCHKLSEGIDIKSLKNIIIFSSSRSRLETIQRMGRCLRYNEKNPEKEANIIDFIEGKYEADIERFTWLSSLSKIKGEE